MGEKLLWVGLQFWLLGACFLALVANEAALAAITGMCIGAMYRDEPETTVQ